MISDECNDCFIGAVCGIGMVIVMLAPLPWIVLRMMLDSFLGA